MAQATVSGTFKNTDGSYLSNFAVTFTLLATNTSTDALVVPTVPVIVYTNSVGYFTVSLFANGTGASAPRYKVELLEQGKIRESFTIYLPGTSSSYAFTDLVK